MTARILLTSLVAGLAIAAAPAQAQKFEGLAQTPPLGWNSWNKFGCDVTEQLIRETADAMVSSGMRDAGYQYVNIDDCWHGGRDAQGNIFPDPKRFPSGMKALADYVHARGLKIGIYSDAGSKTCAGFPGSRGREFQDAATYAAWGVDYLKYDWCNTEGMKAEAAYTVMRDALFATGRPIVFSICEWGETKPWEWGGKVGHAWRTTGDITACWNCEVGHGNWASSGILRILDRQHELRKHSGPGRWNDMDMLEVGNGMSDDEDRAHFTLWSMLNSPLLAGNDLRQMTPATRATLTNRDVIALGQDALAIQAFRAFVDGDIEVWAKPLANDEWALAMLNRGDTAREHGFSWPKLKIEDTPNTRKLETGKRVYRWTELWTRAAGTTAQPFKQRIAPHAVVLLRLKPEPAAAK